MAFIGSSSSSVIFTWVSVAGDTRMQTLLNSSQPPVAAGSCTFRFDVTLCAEIFAGLQIHLTPGAQQAQFGRISGGRAAVFIVDTGYAAHVLWLYEDDARDWFVAKYSHDLQQMREIEQEILAEFGAQLRERRFG